MTINHIAKKLDELRHSIIVRSSRGQCSEDAKDEFLHHVEEVMGEQQPHSWVKSITNPRSHRGR